MPVIPQLNKKINQPSGRKFTFLSLILGTSLALTACGGNEHHEASAVDKVEEASELAKKNAPEPVDLELEDRADTASADATTDADTTESEPADAEEAVTEETAEEPAASSELSADAGKQLYEKSCKQCHDTGLLNSPKIGDKEAWMARTAANDKATLVKHSAEGFNQMPPQAVNGVTVKQVEAAVDYMIEQSS